MNKKERTYEILLNHLTMFEYGRYMYTSDNETFEQYKQAVIMIFQIKDLFLFEDEIIAANKQDPFYSGKEITMQDLVQSSPEKYVSFGLRKRKKDEPGFRQAYFDLWMDLIITPDFPNYDLLFCYQLRNTELLDTDEFLNYTLRKYYGNEPSQFNRFVQITLRKYGQKLLTPVIIETMNEWMAGKEKQVQDSAAPETPEKSKTKGKLKRESGDNLTKLNQEQTALLFQYLQQGKLILKDEYLNNKQAGEAFSILTGYSPDALRQNFSKTELERIANKKNLTDLFNAITSLSILIDKDLKGKK